jgi:magnesium transporter
MVSVARAIEVFDEPTLRRRAAILEQLDPTRGAQILSGLSADQRTETIRHMGELERRRLLPKLPSDARGEAEKLLQYPRRTAGGIMTTEFVRLEPGATVGEALKHIRAVAREKESIYACYVLESGTGRLLGSVSLRDLVMAEMSSPVSNIMRKKPVTVGALDDQEAVAKKIAKYNLLAVPALEKNGSVVGFVTVDDVIDVVGSPRSSWGSDADVIGDTARR